MEIDGIASDKEGRVEDSRGENGRPLTRPLPGGERRIGGEWRVENGGELRWQAADLGWEHYRNRRDRGRGECGAHKVK